MHINSLLSRLTLLLFWGSIASAQSYWEPMIRRESLAGPLAYERVECFSSRGFGATNEDRGNYIGRDQNNWNILCDIEGPGVMSEFGWSRRNPSAELRYRIFVDDTITWDLNVRADSLCGRTSPFLPPLADSSANWSWNYAPVPFHQRLRITYIGNSMAYHGCVTLYDEDAQFESFRSPVPLSYFLKRDTMESVWSQASRPAMWNQPAVFITVESTLSVFEIDELIDYDGSGVVRKLWMIPQDTTRSYLDRTVVKVYVDHNPEPAISAPAGMLFGCSEGVASYHSAITGRSGDTLYFQAVMPFSTEFRLEVQNNLTSPDSNRIRIGTEIVELDGPEVPPYRLGAIVSTSVPTQRYNGFRAAEFYGKGNYLGTYLEIDNTGGSVLEGDEFLHVDGSLVRSGLGTPEYFNASNNWLRPNGLPALARHFAHGVVTVTNNDFTAYRYHISDAVPFTQSLTLDFEVGGWEHQTGNYRSMSMAYLEPQPFSVRDQDSSHSSVGGEILTIYGRGLVNGRELSHVTWNNFQLEIVSGATIVTDSILLIRVRAPYTVTGTAPMFAEFVDGTATIDPAWTHRGTPENTFRVLRDDIDGFAYAGDSLAIELRGYPEGQGAAIVFMDTILPWVGAVPLANRNGVIVGRVTLPVNPALMPEGSEPLIAQALSIEGFPEAISDEYLTAIRLKRIEIEQLPILATQGGTAAEVCACDYQLPEEIDPWGRMLVRRMPADTAGEFVQISLNIPTSGNYRLNYFFGKGLSAGLIRVEIADSLDLDSVIVYDPNVAENTWTRSDTVRGNWRFYNAGVQALTFISSPATPFQTQYELILDQILLESEFHLAIPAGVESRPELPLFAKMEPAFPNPFNPTTRLMFSLNQAADVKLEIFNLLGQHVATLADGHLFAGDYVREFTCPDCASGLYMARLSLPNTMITQKLLLLK